MLNMTVNEQLSINCGQERIASPHPQHSLSSLTWLTPKIPRTKIAGQWSREDLHLLLDIE